MIDGCSQPKAYHEDTKDTKEHKEINSHYWLSGWISLLFAQWWRLPDPFHPYHPPVRAETESPLIGC
jgi:hypothetical protein